MSQWVSVLHIRWVFKPSLTQEDQSLLFRSFYHQTQQHVSVETLCYKLQLLTIPPELQIFMKISLWAN